MKILLDECVTKKLKKHFNNEHQVLTVSQMNWNGFKNGELMKACVDNGFDVLLTIDKNLMYQQNMDKYNLAIVVLNSTTSKIEELKDFILAFENQASSFQPHQIYLVEKE